MKELILHIGMHKTGSTSIQASLNKFDNGTARYAQLCDVNHSIPLYTLFSKNRHDYAVHTKLGLTHADIDQLAEEIAQNLDSEFSLERETLILSGEDISLIEPEGVQALADYLTARAGRVRVLAYVRDPVGFASSALQQYIQGGLSVPRIPEPEYVNRFSKFIDCFGKDAVEFVKFDRQSLHDGSVVNDFCQRVGIDRDDVNERTSNSSISLGCIQLIYHFNNFGLPYSGNAVLARTRLVFMHRLSNELRGPGFKIPMQWVSQCVDMHDVDWMERVSGLKLIDRDTRTAVVDDESDPLQALQTMLTGIDESTIETLRQQVEKIDCHFTRCTDTTSLLNVLFMATYFETLAVMTPPVVEPVVKEQASQPVPPCVTSTTDPSADELRLAYPAYTPWLEMGNAA